MDDRRIDELIADVARGMTAGDPPLALRARVLARVSDRRARGRSWALLATAATATVVAGTWFLTNHPEPPAVASRPAARVEPVRFAAPATTVDVNRRPPAPTVTAPRDAAQGITERATADQVPASDLPPLDRPAQLTVAGIQPASLGIALLSVTPLVMEPLTVPPIDTAGTAVAPGAEGAL